MIGAARGSWQTIIADLALILFMVTAAAMGRQDPAPANPEPASHEAAKAKPAAVLPALAEATGVYRPGPDVPSLREWLAEQAPDDRQRLTILAHYPMGRAAAVFEPALALAREAEGAGVRARILLEPAASADVAAVLAYDRGADWHDDCSSNGTTDARSAANKDEPCE